MAKTTQHTKSEIKAQCHHCGNVTLQKLLLTQIGTKLYEQLFTEKFFEKYEFLIYQCSTCECPNIYGEFEPHLKYTNRLISDYDYIFPKSSLLNENVPETLRKLYNGIYHLRHQAPNAFANQIRRGLELICEEQKAVGKTLFNKIKDLSTKGKFPGHFQDFTDLIRIVGNMGSHASEEEIDIWDAELLNDFFLIVVEYLYVAPKKVKELTDRISSKGKLPLT